MESYHRSLSRWEFKARRQAIIVNRTKDEVKAEEISKAANATKIKAEIFQMIALTQFVKELGDQLVLPLAPYHARDFLA